MTGSAEHRTGGRVLVVEDQATTRAVLRQLLTELGYQVSEAADGATALAALQAQTFELVTLDMILPDMNGIDILRRVRSRHAYHELPVIVISIQDQAAQIVEALSLGANDFIGKPVLPEVLAARIRTHVSHWQGRRRLSDAKQELEAMVARRTADLEQANRELRREMQRRDRAEQMIDDYRDDLEKLVRARTAELDAINREVAAFSYSVSHDLRAPLRAIDGFAQMLVDDHGESLHDDARAYLQRIRLASQRMGALIDAVLRLSRLSRCELAVEDLDLSPFASEIVRKLTAAEPEREVAFEAPRSLPARGDPYLVRILLTSLIDNAFKYTGNRPRARISLGAEEHDGRLVYYVRDDGVGFDMRYAGKLFRPFQRLHAFDEFEGTGIGLATVAQIARRHGGDVSAHGEVDAGATIYFTLSE